MGKKGSKFSNLNMTDKDNTDSKNSNETITKIQVLSKTNPFKKLKTNMLNYLLDFFEYKERKHIRNVNKKFRELIPMKFSKLFVENKEMLNGKEDMTEIYLTMPIPANFLFPIKLKVYVETKDQGWASIGCPSSSWVSLHFYESKEEKDTFKFINKLHITDNFKEKEFKKVEVEYDFMNENENNSLIKKGTIPNGKICIVAYSRYGGWLCYIKQASLELEYFCK